MDGGLQWQLAIDFNEDNKSLSLFLAGLYHAPDAPSLLRERRSQTWGGGTPQLCSVSTECLPQPTSTNGERLRFPLPGGDKKVL